MNDITLFDQIIQLVTTSKEQVAKIKERLPEFHRATAIIGHSTSQASYSLQSLQMISDSDYTRLKQCLAQINQRYNALEEHYYKIERKKIEIKKLSKNTDDLSILAVKEKYSQIAYISKLMESSFRQMGMFQDMYDSIMKNSNIPENWTEKDFEKQEIPRMIRSSFRLAIQDITSVSRITRVTSEYWEQLGIHPHMGELRTREYMINTSEIIKNKGTVDINNMYDFLDKMVEEFGESHKLVLKRIGLDELGSERFMANGGIKPQ